MDRDWSQVAFEGALDVIAVHDPEGIILWASPAYERILGYRPEDMVGQNPYAFVHPNDLAEIEKSHLQSLSTDVGNYMRARFRHGDGHYIWVEASSRTVDQGNGDFIVTVTRPLVEPPTAAGFVPAVITAVKA